jgi:hypothetical protein
MKALLAVMTMSATDSHPLQRWMQSTVAPALKAHNAALLSASLQRLSQAAPPDYEKWGEIAAAGAAHARGGAFDEVRASCGDCHERYRARYRREHRDDTLPEVLLERNSP